MSIAAFAASCGGSKSNPPPPTQNVTVSVAPASATVAPNSSVLFTATVSGTTNTAVTWSAGGVQGGNSSVGTISASGVYTAPATTPNPSTVTISAVSVADTSKSGTAVADVLVHHINQDFQNPPIKLGTSGGNATDKTTSNNKVFCCSGTLGSLISRGGKRYVLSNNHVLDKSDQGTPGDPISQPGLADTNCGQNPNTIVANLTQAATLNPSTNVDAAMGQIVAAEVDTNGTILDLAGPGQPAPPSATLGTAAINQAVAKSGDATGLTCSTINALSLNVRVTYSTQCQGGTTFQVVYQNQIAIQGGSFSNNGDSGSLVVASDTAQPIALLYAGSSTGTVANPIRDVLAALKDPQSGEVPKIVGAPADHTVSCPATPQSQIVAQEKALTISKLSDSEVGRATTVKNAHGTELMEDPSVMEIGVGRSDDNPEESAIVVFIKDQPSRPIPAQIDGVRTKVIRGSEFRPLQNSAQRVPVLPGISDAEVARVRGVKERHAEYLMSNPAVFGVGVGASNDSAGEGTVVIFVERGKQVAIPPEMDGVRTRVIESDPFRAFNWGKGNRFTCLL